MNQYVIYTLAVLAVSFYFFYLANSYGGIKPFLDKELREERNKLSHHRKEVSILKKIAKKELQSSEKILKKTKKDYDRRVKAANIQLQSLLNPGTGKKISRLGPVTLYEHVLMIDKNVYDLKGMRTETAITSHSATLFFILGNGFKLSHTFDTSVRESRDYTENSSGQVEVKISYHQAFTNSDVTSMEADIHNQVLRHEDFLHHLPRRIEEARQRLAQETSNTGAINVATANLNATKNNSEKAAAAVDGIRELEKHEEFYRNLVQSKYPVKANSKVGN